MIHPNASSASLQLDLQRLIAIDDRNIAWGDAVTARVAHLCQLPSGWNGYDARAVDVATANFALLILNSVCFPSTPVPSIVPGVGGDLQIEWHTAAWDIEVHVLAPNLVEAGRAPADRHGAEEETLETTSDFTVLQSWTKRLAEPAFADCAPTAR